MATTRYDNRKTLEEEEANAIGTKYARLDFLRAEKLAGLQALSREYTGLRIQFYRTRDPAALQKITAATTAIQNQLWATVAGAAKLQPTPLSAFGRIRNE